ncbi:MAG TPA: SDR family oxidoreductase [Acidimicrobiales bacterium]|nr:SDR family oxidoreductase [Acidimicrobiales bacterium]
MTGSLEGRTGIVTGAGQGVGRGIALALAGEGANVVIAARRAATGEPVAAEIRDRGGSAICVQTDVTVRGEVEAAVAATLERFGALEIMVHNAFGGRAGASHRLEEVDDRMWQGFSRTAVWGSFHCAQLAFPHLRAAGRHGRLVLVTSPAGVEGSANIPIYAPVKAAQRAMAKSLAREWGEHGITVNCIAPVAETPALLGAFEANPELRKRVTGRVPLGRIGDAERDIGSVVVFLAGDASGYVTGQTIVCDGGSFTGL